MALVEVGQRPVHLAHRLVVAQMKGHTAPCHPSEPVRDGENALDVGNSARLCVRVSLCASFLFGQKGISIAGNFAHRRSLNAGLHCFRRKNLIDSAAHDRVAFACRFFEPRSVNLDQAPPIGSDGTGRPELAHN
jgi:hypothetical protein